MLVEAVSERASYMQKVMIRATGSDHSPRERGPMAVLRPAFVIHDLGGQIGEEMANPAPQQILNPETDEMTSWVTRLRELIAEIDAKLHTMRESSRPVTSPDASLN